MSKRCVIFSLLISLLANGFAYNAPAGGETFLQLVSPMALSGGASSAVGGAHYAVTPVSVLANPALAAEERRIAFDLAYTTAPILGDIRDYAQAFSLGTMVPTRRGVISGGFAGVFSDVAAMPLKNPSTFYASFSKDFFDNFYLGFGLSGGFGADWALGGSLGFVHFIPLGAVKDFRYGASIVNLGKTFAQSDGLGVEGRGKLSYPGVASLKIGAAGTVVSVNNFSLGISLDLTAPTFQNLVVDFGVGMLLADLVVVRSNFQVNLREAIHDRLDLFPSICVACKFKIHTGKSEFLANKGWNESEILPAFCFKTFSEGEQAMSVGATLFLGLDDIDGPEITIGETR